MIVSIIWCLSGIAIGIVFASFFEWVLHKYVMHRPVGKFRYAFQAHAIVHHGTFKADKTYHLLHEKDKETIPMAWWNGPVLVAIGVLPFVLLSVLLFMLTPALRRLTPARLPDRRTCGSSRATRSRKSWYFAIGKRCPAGRGRTK